MDHLVARFHSVISTSPATSTETMDSHYHDISDDNKIQPINNNNTHASRKEPSRCCKHVHAQQHKSCQHNHTDELQQAAACKQNCHENKHRPTYSNHTNPSTGERLLGCEHYARNCKIQAPCCDMWVTCRHCHDVDCITQDHSIDRLAISRIHCMLCNTEQSVSNHCTNTSCGAQFAEYFCGICKFFDNTPGKQMYHCNKCGICRVGRREDFWHCDICQVCISKDDQPPGARSKSPHRCLKESVAADCPVCGEYLATSTKQVILMQCGHGMHLHCFDEYYKTNMNCPVCEKTLMET